MTPVPRLALIGVFDAASQSLSEPWPTSVLNVLGLRDSIAAPFFPMPMKGLRLMFAIHAPWEISGLRVRAVAEDGKSPFHFDLAVSEATESVLGRAIPKPTASFIQHINPWRIIELALPASVGFRVGPGELRFEYEESDKTYCAGLVRFELVPPPPLTADRERAIRSDPRATKFAGIVLRCTECGERLMAYAGLERDPERERKGYVWQAELPDTFTCSCRSTDVDLRSLRKGLHGLLGHLRVNAAELEEFSFQLLYDNVALRAIYNAARSLIYGDPTEQAVQSFLEQNPVLLGTFAPWRIVPKAPVLSLFRTDFLVISSSGHLRLVEIEKPSKALMRKNGVPSAEFTQALHQVQQWLAVVREHKAAVLDPLGIDSKRVTRVTGVLVMGRDDSCPPNQLAILKSSNRDEIEFYTYDDLLGAFANLISTLPTAPPTEILNPNLLAEFEGSSS